MMRARAWGLLNTRRREAALVEDCAVAHWRHVFYDVRAGAWRAGLVTKQPRKRGAAAGEGEAGILPFFLRNGVESRPWHAVVRNDGRMRRRRLTRVVRRRAPASTTS